MKELTCNYAVVRFLPYLETDEFVNVGVIVHCEERNYFDFRIETRHPERIRNFFPELPAEILNVGLEDLILELEKHRAQPDSPKFGLLQFRELTRRRESVLHFGEPGFVLADDPKKALDELFHRFVARQYAHSVQN